MRKLLLGFVLLVVVCFAVYLRVRHRKGPAEVAYAGNRDVTLWSTSAQVREPVGTLTYGERLDVLARSQDQVQVRTRAGVTGWVADGDLLSSDLWQRTKDLEAKAALSPVEARGHTRALSNLHVEPGRDTPRIEQLARSIPIDLLERQTAEVKGPLFGTGAKAAAPGEAGSAGPKKEDWWLVRARLPDQTTVAGWILGRFIDLDVPAPLPDYAASAGMRIVGWFELDRVVDDSGNAEPQYLLVGSKGPEGQPCDFTLMRVYTWGKQSRRYETAYVESTLCGKLPIHLTQPKAPGGDVRFSFDDIASGVPEQRAYYMHQTIVRRERQAGAEPANRKHARG